MNNSEKDTEYMKNYIYLGRIESLLHLATIPIKEREKLVNIGSKITEEGINWEDQEYIDYLIYQVLLERGVVVENPSN